MDSLHSRHGVIYVIFYGNIQIPRISGNFDACADSVYQALFLHRKGSLGSRLTNEFLGQLIDLATCANGM